MISGSKLYWWWLVNERNECIYIFVLDCCNSSSSYLIIYQHCDRPLEEITIEKNIFTDESPTRRTKRSKVSIKSRDIWICNLKRRRKRNLEIVLSFQLKRKKKSMLIHVSIRRNVIISQKKGKERGRQREKRKEKRIWILNRVYVAKSGPPERFEGKDWGSVSRWPCFGQVDDHATASLP